MDKFAIAAILRRARRYVEKGWTQGVSARDANGQPIGILNSKKATRWCASGAIAATPASNMGRYAAVGVLEGTLPRWKHGRPSVMEWNDKKGRTQAQVLRAFDRAIAAAEKAGV